MVSRVTIVEQYIDDGVDDGVAVGGDGDGGGGDDDVVVGGDGDGGDDDAPPEYDPEVPTVKV